jgi:molybdopterin-containing oxidoreductase family iron-sulfur binding subunit
MPSIEPGSRGKAYWRSLDDLADRPEFRERVRREFPAYADEMLAPSRRDFLKVMGASIALAGATACRRWPEELIVPFAHRPDGFVPGVPSHYATAVEHEGAALGLLVTCYDGRPVKVEGNPLHPASLGGTDVLAQASVLDLYDPDREVRVVRNDRGQAVGRTWDEFFAEALPIVRAHRASGGRGLRVLAAPSSSPTLEAVRARFLDAFPDAVWHEWAPLDRASERASAEWAFGRPLRPVYRLDRARVIVSLDADLLIHHPWGVRHARDFAEGRRADGTSMNRLYAVETAYGLTGGVADHRIAVAPSVVPVVAAKLAAALLRKGLPLRTDLEGLRQALAAFERHPFDHPAIDAMAADLLAHRGRGVVAAGPRHPAVVHSLVHFLNEALGNTGETVILAADREFDREPQKTTAIALARDLDAGRVETLLVLGGNPVYDGLADHALAERIARAKNVWRLGARYDETSVVAGWHLPMAHPFEAWSDARAWDGTLGVVQPLILPLYDGKTPAELLAALLEERSSRGYDLVRETWKRWIDGPDFEARWRKVLHDGALEGSASLHEAVPVGSSWYGDLPILAREAVREGIEVAFDRDLKVLDGRFANLGWLQELPDPITRLTWDNAALVAPSTADRLGVGSGDVVEIAVGSASISIPVFVAPGHAAGAVTLPFGYGRTRAGRVADGVGVDVFPLRTTASPWSARAEIRPTGRRHLLATTQDHHVVDTLGKTEREVRAETLIREAERSHYDEHPDFARHVVHVPEDVHLWKPHAYDGYKWGLSIDLNACVGCNACTIACQAENNIPVVGKDEVLRGREMHWIRVDRYFSGDPEEPAVAYQPMACQHCENAPCEQVCPVAATVHDHEGLNVMVYNRCIGTRYCSNNCPYKVRRFNWFNNHKSRSAVEMLVFNPEVTVRSRGVMEKCTFCIQRIATAKIAAKNEGRKVRDGEIVPACAQACPTQAIVFGDLNDEASRIRKIHDDPRSYGILEEINTKPRLRYQARLRNRSEALGGGASRAAAEGHHGES